MGAIRKALVDLGVNERARGQDRQAGRNGRTRGQDLDGNRREAAHVERVDLEPLQRAVHGPCVFGRNRNRYLAASEYQRGRVYVWGDEWITYDSEWSAHTDYQVERFWLNSLKWLTAVGRCQVELPDIN